MDFGRYGGGGLECGPLKKENLLQKHFFQIILYEALKISEK